MSIKFADWTKSREVASLGTNYGSEKLPFQNWRHFKEAFAPELVEQAIVTSVIPVKKCIDPFGGSGTTALACQFLGVHPVTAEVNPFLADLIEAKLVTYNSDELAKDLCKINSKAYSTPMFDIDEFFASMPSTFLEPGTNKKWIFDRAVASHIATLLQKINTLENVNHRRLFRVLLGGILVEVSNVAVNGKGRRYRQNWENRRCDPQQVDSLFRATARRAMADIYHFRRRAFLDYDLIRGDCRCALTDQTKYDLAVFSPPYPNSFDYTDVYNLELWMLGYLTNREDDCRLRRSTLCSHVQISRDYLPSPVGSITLEHVAKKLDGVVSDLWHRRLPAMVSGYFADMMNVMSGVYEKLNSGGTIWLVVGDSRYAHIHVNTAKILSELIQTRKWTIDKVEPFRSMRVSPQQGGRQELAETLIVVSKN